MTNPKLTLQGSQREFAAKPYPSIAMILTAITAIAVAFCPHQAYASTWMQGVGNDKAQMETRLATEVQKPLDNNLVWDKKYLQEQQEISTAIEDFRLGKLCPELAGTRMDMILGMDPSQIERDLKEAGLTCNDWRPLTVLPDGKGEEFLLKGQGTTQDPNNPNVAKQLTCVNKNLECEISFRPDGLPNSPFPLRRNAHAYAALLGKTGKYGTFENQRCKLGVIGGVTVSLPKGPRDGLHCPYDDADICSKWTDLIMDKVHPLTSGARKG